MAAFTLPIRKPPARVRSRRSMKLVFAVTTIGVLSNAYHPTDSRAILLRD
jgi:hypothetical protein